MKETNALIVWLNHYFNRLIDGITNGISKTSDWIDWIGPNAVSEAIEDVMTIGPTGQVFLAFVNNVKNFVEGDISTMIDFVGSANEITSLMIEERSAIVIDQVKYHEFSLRVERIKDNNLLEVFSENEFDL